MSKGAGWLMTTIAHLMLDVTEFEVASQEPVSLAANLRGLACAVFETDAPSRAQVSAVRRAVSRLAEWELVRVEVDERNRRRRLVFASEWLYLAARVATRVRDLAGTPVSVHRLREIVRMLQELYEVGLIDVIVGDGTTDRTISSPSPEEVRRSLSPATTGLLTLLFDPKRVFRVYVQCTITRRLADYGEEWVEVELRDRSGKRWTFREESWLFGKSLGKTTRLPIKGGIQCTLTARSREDDVDWAEISTAADPGLESIDGETTFEVFASGLEVKFDRALLERLENVGDDDDVALA